MRPANKNGRKAKVNFVIDGTTSTALFAKTLPTGIRNVPVMLIVDTLDYATIEHVNFRLAGSMYLGTLKK